MRTPWWKRLMSLSRSARVRNRFVGCLFLRLRLRLCLCLKLRSRQLETSGGGRKAC
jgi:hypothetical protein